MFRHQGQFLTESYIPPHDNVADDSKTRAFEYYALWRLVGWAPTAHNFFECSIVDALWYGAHANTEPSMDLAWLVIIRLSKTNAFLSAIIAGMMTRCASPGQALSSSKSRLSRNRLRHFTTL
ncbi:hypothetical protein TNCV_1594941 [Trichonephila clavipes]|nr:hypothetical protein TNCV_1594941 [Trichonephila clavipes]